MVSETDIRRCTSEEVVFRRGVDTRRCVGKDAGPRREVVDMRWYVSKDVGPRRG